ARLEYHLDWNAGHGANDGFHVGGYQRGAAAPERAEVLHHVDLARAVRHRERGCVGFDVRPIDAMREADHARDLRVGALQRARGERHPAWLAAPVADAPRAHDFDAGLDIGRGGFRLENGVIEQARELVAGHGFLLPWLTRAAR